MPIRPPHLHILHLISELRQSAIEGRRRVENFDDDGLHVSLASGLMVDAADALEAMLAERPANDVEIGKKRDGRRK